MQCISISTQRRAAKRASAYRRCGSTARHTVFTSTNTTAAPNLRKQMACYLTNLLNLLFSPLDKRSRSGRHTWRLKTQDQEWLRMTMTRMGQRRELKTLKGVFNIKFQG